MKKIIVAPLNWGLGHASRCVPIIHFLLENGYTPVIASDGEALQFLQQEFPMIASVVLPSYGISYAKNLKTALFFQIPTVYSAIRKEQEVIENLLAKDPQIVGIISDNRFGARSKKVPSVYMTHQVHVLSGVTTYITSKIHQKIIQKFDICWIPDSKEQLLSGKLSNTQKLAIPFQFIGVLSRFKKKERPLKNEVLIILSGIASQRKYLEDIILQAFKNYQGNVVLVQGKIEDKQTVTAKNGIKIYNYLLSAALENAINESKSIVCRSGYSSIMDLSVVQKKVFFIPTLQQSEQEYLARHLKKQQKAPFSTAAAFNLKQFQELKNYKGLYSEKTQLDKKLLRLF